MYYFTTFLFLVLSLLMTYAVLIKYIRFRRLKDTLFMESEAKDLFLLGFVWFSFTITFFVNLFAVLKGE